MRLIVAPTWKPRGRAPRHFKGRRQSWRNRTAAQVTALVMHQTAVGGGFGARDTDARVKRYGGRDMERRGVPYHYVISPQDDAVIALWHPRMYGYHGNGSNSYSLGVAWDGASPGDEVDAPQLEQAISLLVGHAREAGFDALEHLEAHAQHSDQRGTDPGPDIWPIVEGAALTLGIVARPHHKTGTGRELPESWRYRGGCRA